ncbi:MAG: hypothetical protein CMI53_04470 [Parcubacteria group bacterium]|nr:hypothetical protein [Parcubacteria group bacterium]
MANRVTEWFVEPLNSYSNEALATALAITDLNDIMEEVRDGDGHPHKVYRVDYPIIRRLRQDAISDQCLQFKEFSRECNYGPVRLAFKFGRRRPPKIETPSTARR